MEVTADKLVLCNRFSVSIINPWDPFNTAGIKPFQPSLNISRLAAWPDETPLREKLYGDLAALRKTASFVRAPGVDV